MLFSLCYRQLTPLGVGECVEIGFPWLSYRKFGLKPIKHFVAVSIELRQALPPNHTEVAFWKEVSATKLVSEFGFSLGFVNCLASIGPCALWIRILIDAHAGISTVDCKSNVMDTGHAVYRKIHWSQLLLLYHLPFYAGTHIGKQDNGSIL